MHTGVLRGHGRHGSRTTKHHRPHIAVPDVLDFGRLIAGAIDLFFLVRNGNSKERSRSEQPFRMLLKPVDAPGINALAFEHAGGKMKRMRQHMHFAFAPGNDLSVKPERAIAFVERYDFRH